MGCPVTESISRSRALIIPFVSVWSRPNGLPMAYTTWPTFRFSDLPSAIGGGNFLVLARSRPQALKACEAAIAAMRRVRNVIMPFPGGVVRSGSKVGSKYKTLMASTNDAFCPTLRGRVKSELGPDTVAVLEIVIDGLSSKSVADAMKAALKSLIEVGPSKGVTRISAGNYGGKLGQHHYHLRELLP